MLDQGQWTCSNNHVVSGVGEGKQAQPCPECKETLEARLNAFVTSRLAALATDIANDVHRQFYKSGGVPKSISYHQFFKAIFGSHGQAGTGIKRAIGVSARQPCTNWCRRPDEDLKEVFPKLSGDKQINVAKIAPLLEALSTSQNPLSTFKPAVLSRSFPLGSLLTYLWCELAMQVGSIQESWDRYHHLVPLTIWNCKVNVIYGKLQSLSMEAGDWKENDKLRSCILQWFRADMSRSNTARFGDLTHAIQISQVRRKIRTASPGRGDPTLDQSVNGLDLNVAGGPPSYSNDELWRAHGPQTLLEACSFIGRVIKSSSENQSSVCKALQQILRKDARDNLFDKGIVEFELSDSETSEPESKDTGKARPTKRKHQSTEEPRSNTTSDRGGKSGCKGKNLSQKSKRAEVQVLPPPNKRPRGGSQRGARGGSHPNPYYRQGNRSRSPPRLFRCPHCSGSCDRYDHFCRGCGRRQV